MITQYSEGLYRLKSSKSITFQSFKCLKMLTTQKVYIIDGIRALIGKRNKNWRSRNDE